MDSTIGRVMWAYTQRSKAFGARTPPRLVARAGDQAQLGAARRDAVTPRAFDPVHRAVGFGEQALRGAARVRIHGHTDAATERHGDAPDVDRLADGRM